MEITTKLSSFINYYTEKNNSASLDFKEFCINLKKYAEENIEEKPELVKYLNNTAATVTAELEGLAEKHLAILYTNTKKKKAIFSFSFLANSYYNIYNEILKRAKNPYPIAENISKDIPLGCIQIVSASEYITNLIDEDEKTKKSKTFTDNIIDENPVPYIIDFEGKIPALIIPSNVTIDTLLSTAQHKIRKIMRKEEYHDYFLKKLRSTNPTKEISIRNFFSSFIDNEEFVYSDFSEGDLYYIWNQTLFYIRQDFEKIQDKTLEDINALQACLILEIQSSYIKEKMQNLQRRGEALNCLSACLMKAPYFFSMQQIIQFQDENGRLLYGRYSENDLKNFLTKETSEQQPNRLPNLLVFKVASGTKYYIYKKNITPVLVRLCDEAHVTIENEINKTWYNNLLNFKKTPEMYDPELFEDFLHDQVESQSPILHSILTANFLTLYISECQDNASVQLFSNGHVKKYKDLLLLYNERLLANAKNRLPFYYNIPIISWFLRLISYFNSKETKKIENKKEPISKHINEEKKYNQESQSRKVSKEEAFAVKAKKISKELIPEGSSLNRELDYLIKQWNILLTPDAYNNLIDDVNNLIRDYTRRVMKTISVNTFSKERVNELANNLIDTPNMKKISDKEALKEYVILYILKLVTNYQK